MRLSRLPLASLLLPGIAFAQYTTGVGIESANSISISSLGISRTIYTGECPGIKQYPVTGYFVSDIHPPTPGSKVKLTNMSRGLSPDNPPFTLREYSRGRASQSFEIALGDKHRGSYFVVRPGQNMMQYEIMKNGNITDHGTFTVNVSVSDSQEYRGKERYEVTKYNTDGSKYQTYEYRCPY